MKRPDNSILQSILIPPIGKSFFSLVLCWLPLYCIRHVVSKQKEQQQFLSAFSGLRSALGQGQHESACAARTRPCQETALAKSLMHSWSVGAQGPGTVQAHPCGLWVDRVTRRNILACCFPPQKKFVNHNGNYQTVYIFLIILFCRIYFEKMT